MARTDTFYWAWQSMKQRCINPKYRGFKYWGGRGISYNPQWEKFSNFEKDMRTSYKKGLWLDRIDNNKNYSKENCRWATPKEQQNNRRNNHLFGYMGIFNTLTNWSKILNIKESTLKQRYYCYHWSVQRTLSEGVRKIV